MPQGPLALRFIIKDATSATNGEAGVKWTLTCDLEAGQRYLLSIWMRAVKRSGTVHLVGPVVGKPGDPFRTYFFREVILAKTWRQHHWYLVPVQPIPAGTMDLSLYVAVHPQSIEIGRTSLEIPQRPIPGTDTIGLDQTKLK